MIQRHELIDVGRPLAHHLPDPAVVRLRNLLDIDVLSREAANDLRSGGLPHPPGEADEQDIGEVHDIRPQVGSQPLRELLDFLAMMALFPGERGAGERAEIGSPRGARATGKPGQ